MTATELAAILKKAYPANATGWNQATDEVRDMSRYAREELELGEDSALDFRRLRTPSDWNREGVASIVSFYERMTPRQREGFLARAHGMY